jgi:peptidoglycan hydrolase CwlO-like protein
MKEMQDNLDGINEAEKVTLKELFLLSQEIEEMEREEIKITNDIQTLEADINILESKIKTQQEDYDSQLSVLKKVLVSYERMGPASYLETLLSAEDFTTFLRSINIIRNLSHNVNKLLDSIEVEKKQLTEEKDVLDNKVAKLEEKREALKEPLLKKQQLKAEQEAYLNSLEGDKLYYKEQLDNLEQMWEASKKVFTQIVDDFKTIISSGSFQTEDLNINFSFGKISGSINEDTFNRIIEENSKLPKLVFHFKEDQIEIEIPENHLILRGKFTIEDKSSLKFQVESGSFYDLPLE